MPDSRSVCIIGAGPAGIVTAKVFLEDGFDVTVYEKYDEIGGTWSSHRRYVNLQHQLGKGLFEFSDMPNDAAYEDAESIQEYLREYADRHGVTDRIRFETEVRELAETDDGWSVVLERTEGDDRVTVTKEFEYVAVCCGFHHIPKTPDVPGEDAFEGSIHHSSEVHSEEQLRDKDVVIVGGGKSAADLSAEAGRLAASTTFVFREANWLYPKKILGGLVPNRFVFYSRFGEALLPRYYNEDCVRLIDRIPQGVKDKMWDIIETDLLVSGGLRGLDEDIVPDRELPHDIVHTGILPDTLPDLLEEGAVTAKQATVERIDPDGVHLDTDEFVPADVIVFATGFRKTMPFLESELDLKTDDGQFRLYRSIVPIEADNIGVVGLRQTFNNILTMEITAHWLAAYFQEDLVEMPTAEEMRETLERRLEWQEQVMPGTRGYHYGPYDLHAVDELLKDMGAETLRSKNPISEYFLPVARSRRYADLGAERAEQAAPEAVADGRGEPAGRSITSVIPFL